MVSQLLLYSMKSAMTLVMLYVPYIFMLRKEKFFHFNRRVLLGIVAISLILPMLNVSWLSVDDVPVVQATHQQMVDVGIPVNMGEYIVEDEPLHIPAFTPARIAVSTTRSISWFDVLAIVFFAGMVVSIIVRSFQLGILSYAVKHGCLWEKKLENGIRICCRRGRFSSYSWMNTIVISEDDWRDGQHEILLHESGHILARHSYDMLFLMVCQAVQWYNPCVWLMSRSLAEVHEYEADQYVLEQGVPSTEYMMLLLRKVSGDQSYSFVNGFNKDSIKQRIMMMKETAKSPWRRIKAIYVLPVCLVALSAFATQKMSAPIEEMLESLETTDAGNSITKRVEKIAEIATNNSVLVEAHEAQSEDYKPRLDSIVYDGPRHKKEIYKYNRANQLKSIEYYEMDGSQCNKTNRRDYFYNEEGCDTLCMIYAFNDGAERLVKTVSKRYNKDHAMTEKKETAYANGRILTSFIYKNDYNDNGKIVQSHTYALNGNDYQLLSIENYKYGITGKLDRIQVESDLDRDKKICYETIYHYNDLGLVDSKTDSPCEGRMPMNTNYIYSDTTLVKSITTVADIRFDNWYSHTGEPTHTTQYVNEDGHWVSKQYAMYIYDNNNKMAMFGKPEDNNDYFLYTEPHKTSRITNSYLIDEDGGISKSGTYYYSNH